LQIGKQIWSLMNEHQLYHNDENEFLWKLLADPVNNTHLYTYNLQRLVNDNPQSGIFRALLARTGGEENFKLASVHFNSKSLYKLINYPSGFEKITGDKIILFAGIASRPVYENTNSIISENHLDPGYENNGTVNIIAAEQEHVVVHPEEIAHDNETIQVETFVENINNNQHIAPQEHVDENNRVMEVSMAAEYDLSTGHSVSQSGVFGSDVSLDQLKDYLKNIKAGAKPTAANDEIIPANKENRAVGFHYTTIPYSFMWWLDKTRSELPDSFQPYAKPKTEVVAKPKVPIDELQHQYIENIFHLTSVEELDKSTADKPVTWDFNRKESKIIERFLEKEPQIKPQQADKLDNENKAKQSSEDSNEIVTETLAAIYAEQMLYQKSIAAYKKLMLRFPEKSLYFADKIEQLEKKTNL
jgi:hypothetical protein